DGEASELAEFLRLQEEGNRAAREHSRRSVEFIAIMKGLCDDVVAGRVSLRETAERVSRTERGRAVVYWMHPDHPCVDLPLEQRLAVFVLRRAADSRTDRREARAVLLRLQEEYRYTWGSPPPTAGLPLLEDLLPAGLEESGPQALDSL